MAVLWPFPGHPVEHRPPHNLPPPRFAVGDRVTTKWGSATVQRVCDYYGCSGSRTYHLRHDWCSSPEGFGHFFDEDDMQPLAEQAQAAEPDDAADDEAALRRGAEQMELFA